MKLVKTTLKTDRKRLTEYYDNGSKCWEVDFKDDRFEGSWNFWYEDGQKKREGNHKKGVEVGLWTYWDKEGNVTKTETYKDGELVKP